MSKFLYPIYKLNIESYKKWWLYHKKAGGSGILSEILQGFSFNLENTLNRKFKLFEIEGNSTQNGTTSPIYSAGDNENLFDTSLLPITKNGVTISKDSKGNVVLNGTPTITSGYINFIVSSKKQLSAGTYTASFKQKKVGIGSVIVGWGNAYLNLTLDETINKKTATINDNGEAQFNINVRYDVGTLDNFILNPKLEKGNKASGYSPYGMGSINEKITNSDGTEEQDYSIFVQQPFRSIGDVRDCFVKKNGTWYERHYVLRLRILSNMSIESYNLGVNSYLINLENNCKYITDKIVSISNYFKGSSYDDRGTAGNNIIYPINNGHSLVIRNTEFATIEELKAFFDNNEVYVEYLPETPLYLPCTETQIQQLENLPSTYKEMTIINSQDETPAHLKIQYYKEG